MSQEEQLLLKQMCIGPMANYQYFIGDRSTKDIAVVDPAWDIDALCHLAEKDKLRIIKILLTHGHMDHANGAEELQSRLGVPVYLSRHEADFYKPDRVKFILTDDKDKIAIGSIQVQCLHTPGHTPGCQCYKAGNVLLTGDTLFINGCGRCDLPGGDANAMYNTLYRVLMVLPEETEIYPGHQYGPLPHDSLREQKMTNPYLMCSSKEEFIYQRMGL